MIAGVLYRRYAESALRQALEDTPVVLLHGPRQCGKTTLARQIGKSDDFAYFSFDDTVLLSAAAADPMGFIDDLPERVILDEVQRVPQLSSALKAAVDGNRKPGRFLLTGSANVLLVPRLADSLAGRMEIFSLHPMAQCEVEQQPPHFLDALFAADFVTGMHDRMGRELAERIVGGGYPSALTRSQPHRRAAWYRGYVETMIQRDVRDLARISSLDALPRLLALAAGQSARLLNISDLAAPFQLSRPTIKDYVTLLERVFLLETLPPWHTNRLSRLVKTPKLHLGDTGLACALLGLTANNLWADRQTLGQFLETFVFQELRRQASWRDDDIRFHHFRDRDGSEVDIVLERSGLDLAGVEVKASATVTASDFRGLRKLREAAADRFVAGVVLYDGMTTVSFGKGLFAVPVRSLWSSLR